AFRSHAGMQLIRRGVKSTMELTKSKAFASVAVRRRPQRDSMAAAEEVHRFIRRDQSPITRQCRGKMPRELWSLPLSISHVRKEAITARCRRTLAHKKSGGRFAAQRASLIIDASKGIAMASVEPNRGGVVLIVDDDDDARAMLRDMLEGERYFVLE